MRSGSVTVETTLPGSWSNSEVETFALGLVESGSAACVQFKRVHSVYRWQGKCESEEEWALSIKCREAAKERLVARIETNHPYDLPQIIIHSIETSVEFGEWIHTETDD